jgi:hypothetical protein
MIGSLEPFFSLPSRSDTSPANPGILPSFLDYDEWATGDLTKSKTVYDGKFQATAPSFLRASISLLL